MHVAWDRFSCNMMIPLPPFLLLLTFALGSHVTSIHPYLAPNFTQLVLARMLAPLLNHVIILWLANALLVVLLSLKTTSISTFPTEQQPRNGHHPTYHRCTISDHQFATATVTYLFRKYCLGSLWWINSSSSWKYSFQDKLHQQVQ